MSNLGPLLVPCYYCLIPVCLIIAPSCWMFIILCSSDNGVHVYSQFGDTILLGFWQDCHVNCETLCPCEDIIYGFSFWVWKSPDWGSPAAFVCPSWESVYNTFHDEGGHSSARSIICHSIILECSVFCCCFFFFFEKSNSLQNLLLLICPSGAGQ